MSKAPLKPYQSKFGPRYNIGPHFHGINTKAALKFGTTAAYFGVSAGIFAIFFFAEIPRLRRDVIEKVPILGDYFHVEIAPEDNPF